MTKINEYKKIRDLSITKTKYWNIKPLIARNNIFFTIKTFLNTVLNKWFLSKIGYSIVRVNSILLSEQHSYPLNKNILNNRNQNIANFLCKFFKSYNIGFDNVTCKSYIDTYEDIFRNNNISNLNGGTGFNNGLILFILVKHFSPKKIIESGIWRGYTTYLLDQASNDIAKIYCYDINLDRIQYKSKKAYYYEEDITENVNHAHDNVDFAFFDDHVAHFDRIKYCMKKSIDIIILDDDVTYSQVHADGWPPIPTASMVYNYKENPHLFSWMLNGNKCEANIENLEVDEIVDTYEYIPFPNLKEFTGYESSSASLLLKK